MTRSAKLSARRNAAVPRGIVTATPVFAARAENAELWDMDGQRYVDFAGGIGSLATGHRHPKVIAAASDQLGRYTHPAFQVMAYEPYVALAERLNALAPFRGGAKTLLMTTGVEAVENAVKIARAATGRSAVIAFSGAFHGRTIMATALTGKVTPYKQAFGPLIGDVFHVPYPAPYRGVSVQTSLAALEMLFQVDIDPSRVAAIIIEPVQGEGGFHVAPPEFLRELRTLCDVNGILLIADEIQCGIGRTGRMFAIEHANVEPDLITIAKSLAGGFPLSAVLGRAGIMDFLEPGGLGSTFGGFPPACAAALAVLEVIDEQHLLERATLIGTRMRAHVSSWAGKSGLTPIANLRGLGAMIGFDIVGSDGKPDGRACKLVTTRALERGLIVLSAGHYGETIRILVPLTAADGLLDEGMGLLELALKIPEAH